MEAREAARKRCLRQGVGGANGLGKDGRCQGSGAGL